MPRRARLAVPNAPLHIIQRGNNRQAGFYADGLDFADALCLQASGHCTEFMSFDDRRFARRVEILARAEARREHTTLIEMTVQFRRNDRVDFFEDRAHELRA